MSRFGEQNRAESWLSMPTLSIDIFVKYPNYELVKLIVFRLYR
jgi:hypothetical protein